MEELFSQSSDRLTDITTNPPEGKPDGIYTYPGVDASYKKENGKWYKSIGNAPYEELTQGNVAERIKQLELNAVLVDSKRPNGIYTYPGVDALYKKEDGIWYRKTGDKYTQLFSGNVPERIKQLELNSVKVEKDEEPLGVYRNNQDFDVIQPVRKLDDNFQRPSTELFPGIRDKVNVENEFKIPNLRLNENEEGIKIWQQSKSVDFKHRPIDPRTGELTGLSYHIVYEDITDPKKVSKLNSKYNQDASTINTEKVFTGYPGKEGTEYIIDDNNLWKVKRPGSQEFLTITDPNSVKSLNSHFKQSADVFDQDKAVKLKKENEKILDLRYRINKIDENLIGDSEGNVVEKLSELFPEYEFSEAGWGTDNVLVKSKSNEIMISLDNWSSEDDNNQAILLRNFLRYNISDAYLEEKSKQAKIYQRLLSNPDLRRLLIKDEKSAKEKGISPSYTLSELKQKAKETKEDYLSELSERYKEIVLNTKNLDEKEKKAAISNLKQDKEEISIINKYADDLKYEYNSISKYKNDINNSIIGLNKSSKEIDSDKKNIELYIKNIKERVNNNQITQEELDEANLYIKDQYSKLNIKIEKHNKESDDLKLNIKKIDKRSLALKDNLNNLSNSQNVVQKSIAANFLINEKQGTFIGGLGYSAVDGILSIPRMIARADKETKDEWIKAIVGAGTTEQYMNSDDRWDITKAAFQMSRSMSAMAAGWALTGGGTLAPAAIGEYLSLYAMSYYEMKDELDQMDIPGLSEEDKVLMSGAYGVVGSVLERFGLSYALGNKILKRNISNQILKLAFSQIPKNASKEMVEAQIGNSIKTLIGKGVITTLGTSLVEGGVEGSQRLAQLGIEEVYDRMKGTGYFNNESAYEILGDVAYESYMGFLGGGIVETIQQSGNVLKNGTSAFKNEKQIQLLIESSRTLGIDEALVSKLKSDMLNGKITKQEAEDMLNSFKEIKGKINSIPSDMSIENQSKALDLILERDKLNKEIEGKDPNLVKPQSDRITEINNRLQELSKENAVQEPSTEGVLPRQPETTGETGGEREGMGQGVQGQEVAQEGSQEKIDLSEGISDQSKTSESYSEDVVQVREPRRSGYKNTIVKKTETTDEKGGKEVKYEKYAVDENGNERKMSTSGGIETTVGEFAPLTNENNLFYDEDGNLKYDANTEVSINSVAEYKDENGNIKYSTELTIRTNDEPANGRRIITNVNPVNEGTYRTESISKFQGTVSDETTKTSEEVATVKEEIVPGATAKVADVDIVYPTEPQAEERKAFRSTSEYVENVSKELPIEDVETLTKELEGDFGLLTAENPMAQPLTEEENKQLNQKAEEWLNKKGYKPRRVTGKYGQAENSFFVPNLTRQDAIEFAKQFNQESVAHSDGLVYQDGSMNPRVKANDNLSFTESYSPESDFVSVVNTKDGLKTFSIGYNFDEKVMPEQQAATQISEVTITPETSQTVTERINKETDTKRKKVFTAVQKVLSAIPNAKIILHDNTDSFVAGVAKSLNKTKEDAKNEGADTIKGAYVNGDIHINLEKASVTTVFHEAFHDLLAKKGMENNALLDMAKGLKSVISDKALKQRLDKFVSNYEQGERAEEYTTELGAIMAEAQKELSTTKFQQFKTLVNKIAKKLGLPVVFSAASTAQDAVDFMNSMAGKLGKGEQIEVGEYVENPIGVIKAEKTFGSEKNKITVVYAEQDKIDELIKKGLLEQVDNIHDIGEVFAATTSPDDMLAGAIFLNGKKIADGYGGIYFVTMFNDVWASSNEKIADQIAKRINKSLRDNPNNKGYLFLVKGSDAKLISSPQGATSSLKVLESMVQDGLISASDFRSAINQSMKDNPDTKAKINLQGNMSLSDMIMAVDSLFDDVKKSSFDNRGTILKSIIINLGNTESVKKNDAKIKEFLRVDKNNKLGWSKTSKTLKTTSSVLDLIANISREDITRGLNNGDIYAAIEVNGEVEVKPGDHKSYPFHIKTKDGSSPKLILFKNRKHGRDVLSSENNETSEELGASFDGKVLGTASNGFGYGKVREQQPSKIKAQKQSKEDAIQDAKDKYELSVEKRGKDHKTGVTAAIADLQKSDWYRDADDIQREEAVREIKNFFGEKIKSAPSVAKVTGKTKQTAFVSDLAAAIRDQIKIQARSSRETAKNINDRRKALGTAIKEVVSKYKGKITERQLKSINTRIANVNLFNQEMVERVIDYVNKVMNNAEYATKVNNAFAERRAIRRMMKSGNMAETVAVAKEFTQIDPSMVDDIDAYLEMAKKIREAIKSSRRVGETVSLKQIVNFGEAYEYIKPVLDAQEESMKNMLLAEYNDLAEAGVISKDMTLKDINKILNKIRLDEKVDSNEEESAREFLKNKLYLLKLQLGSYIENKGYNPLTGEVIEISDRNKQIIAKIVKSDMNNMSTKQMTEMVDSLSNFVENGAVGGIEAAYNTYVGEENAASLEKQGVVARPLKMYFNKKLGQIFGSELTSLTELFNRMFVGAKKGIDVMTKSGFADVVLGANKARRQVKEIQNNYVKKFGKIKNFFQIENVYERGALAFLTRNLIGSDIEVKSEFNRRVDILLQSIDALRNGTEREQKMADVYEKVLGKLDVNSRDLNTIKSKASSTNIEAVEWWINEWSTHYSDLSDVSKSVYNTILGKDVNYTPDRLKTTSEGSSQTINDKILESKSAFLMNTDAITDTNESGVMIASVRPKQLPKGRYVSLDFDVNNIESLTGALVDINTAGAIRQVSSFFGSKSFKSIVPSVEDRAILNERVNKYIRRAKNKLSVPSDVFRNIDNSLNTISGISTALGLGGITQAIKQTVSVAASTLIQTGTDFNIYAGESFNNWLNTTGATVANRGQESLTSIESTNKKLQSFNGKFDQALTEIKKLTQWQLRLFLSKPDVFVARAAFKSYYEQYLKQNGYDVSKINWDTWNDTIKKEGIEELNKKAIIYADTMVSRQQNVSDERLAGELLANEDSARKIFRKMFLPFASFSINQRARFVADINALFLNWNNISKEDKAIAIKSIAGTVAEQAVFQSINFTIGMSLYSIAQSLAGHDDDDDEWKERILNATKYPLRSLFADFVSPNPLSDDAVIFGVDQLLAMMDAPSDGEIKQAIEDEQELRIATGKQLMTESQINKFKEEYIKENTYQLSYNFSNHEEGKYGLFSITIDQYKRLSENFEMAKNGTFTDDYMGKKTTKYLTDKDKLLAKSIFYGLEVPYSTGAGLKEMGQVANKTYSIIKKRALTEDQYEVYKEFKKEFKREPQEWEINMIKSSKSPKYSFGAMRYVQDFGGLSNQQGKEYAKVFEKTGRVLPPAVFDMIKQGKSSYKAFQKYKQEMKKELNTDVSDRVFN